MKDLAHMLAALVAGIVNAMVAWTQAGTLAMLVVAGSAGWVMAQYDHNYKRVKGDQDG